MHSFYKIKNPENSVFFERKRMLKKEAAGWEGPAAEAHPMIDVLESCCPTHNTSCTMFRAA
jgi:hypothetical protein